MLQKEAQQDARQVGQFLGSNVGDEVDSRGKRVVFRDPDSGVIQAFCPTEAMAKQVCRDHKPML